MAQQFMLNTIASYIIALVELHLDFWLDFSSCLWSLAAFLKKQIIAVCCWCPLGHLITCLSFVVDNSDSCLFRWLVFSLVHCSNFQASTFTSFLVLACFIRRCFCAFPSCFMLGMRRLCSGSMHSVTTMNSYLQASQSTVLYYFWALPDTFWWHVALCKRNPYGWHTHWLNFSVMLWSEAKEFDFISVCKDIGKKKKRFYV